MQLKKYHVTIEFDCDDLNAVEIKSNEDGVEMKHNVQQNVEVSNMEEARAVHAAANTKIEP